MLSPKISLLLAFAVSASLTWLMISLCRRKGWLFHPRAERWSRRSVAKFGGVPIIVSLVLLARFQPLSPRLQWVVLLTGLMAIVGLWDDIKPLPPVAKLAFQIGLAIAAVFSGVLYPVPLHSYLSVLLTVVWIVGVTNAFNLLDNMDGLSAGVAMIASLSLVVLVSDTLIHPVAALTFAGALGGFLLFNFSPAKIFMGDTGSLAIGFFLSCISVIAAERIRETASILIVPALVVFIPIFDTLLVSITRRINGRAISAGARDHSSHRLVLLGLSERQAVLTLYLVSAMGALVAYASKVLYPEAGIGIIAVFLFGAGLFWLYLAQLSLPEDWLSRTNVATLAIPEFLNSLSKRASMVFLDATLIVLSLYLSFLLRFDGVDSGVEVFLLVCAAALSLKLVFLALFGAYRRTSATSRLYAIVKAVVISSLSLVAVLTFINRFADLSRAVFAIDLVMSVALLASVRFSHSMFEDMLSRHHIKARCVIVGDGSAILFQNYFKWKETDKLLVGTVLTSGKPSNPGLTIPAFDFAELPGLLATSGISEVYLLPDCPPEHREAVVSICATSRIAVRRFDFGVIAMEQDLTAIPGRFQVKLAERVPAERPN